MDITVTIPAEEFADKLYEAVDKAVDNLIAKDCQPVTHVEWIYGENEDGQDGIFCSECDHFVPWYYDYYDKTDDLINDNPRCPNCGAMMDRGVI